MKKKKILVSLLCIGAVLGVASCNTPEVTPTPETPPVTETPVTPTPTPAVVKYTVTFNSNGGSAINSVEVEENKKVTAPAAPTKEGYNFVGWFSDEALTKEWSFDTAITANTTLYAKWEAVVVEQKYNVVYDINDLGTQPAVLENVAALPAELPVLTAEGYNFLGWYTDEACTVKAVAGSAITANTVLYAKWEKAVVEQANAIEMNGVAYETITAALAAIPTSGDTSTYTIRLNKGTYKENGLSYNGTATIHIIGNTNAKYGADVIIEGRGNNMGSMRGRELLEIQGTGNIILENISLVSDVSRAEGLAASQAEVLGTDTKGNTVAYNCSFYSHQDTIRTAGKAWFYGCYVEGDTDFIWMEASGSVALYENCEIVSVYDEHATTHASYIAAPRMGVSSKVGKGLVFLNSVVRESAAAKENGQLTYLARSPWTSGYYNQVAYINTQISDVELEATSKAPNAPWYGNMIATEYPETVIGWKLDSKSAASLNLTGKDYILSDAVTGVEYNGRETILNRIYNTGRLKYEKDSANYWDIASLIAECGFEVSADSSSATLEGEVVAESTVYVFDGNTDYSSICNGFAQDQSKPHYAGKNGSTITIPVNGKSYVEIYGYYAGAAEVKADTDNGYALAFFNNGSTSTEIEYDYIVYDANAKSVVITAKATTYITKIVVTPDSTIGTASPVTEIEINRSSAVETVGVAVTLTASVNKDASNKSVVWSSSDESVASIDPYNGRITFKKAGSVTFTATACDGSGITESIECNPKEANWTVSEWYTTDNDVTTEEGAEGINNFAPGSESAYKGLTSSYSFTNLAGQTITTSKGFKLNSKGQLSIAITKPAVLTLVVFENGNTVAVPVVSNGTVTVTPTSSTTSEDGKTYTHVYHINDVGMFDIVRGDNSSENNPLLYVKCEYVEPVISTSTGLTFKGSHYTEGKTGIADIITPEDTIDATDTTIYFDEFKLTNCKDNGKANWLVFNTGAKIEFKVSGACTVLVGYYSKLQTVKINGVVVEGNKEAVNKGDGEIVEYEITEAGTVTIEVAANDYLGFVGVLFKTLEMRKADAIKQLEAAYPAKNYTQNADYATVLEAQKAAINAAADEAALKVAYDAAVVAMDALEVDKVEEETRDFEVTFGSNGNYKDSGIDFSGINVRDNGGDNSQIKEGSFSFAVEAGAIVTINGYPSYTSYKLSDGTTTTEEITDTKYVYNATTDCTITITPVSGNNYFYSLSVVYPATLQDIEVTFGSNGNYKDSGIDFSGINIRDNGGDNAQIKEGSFSFVVAAGATVTINGYPSYTSYKLSDGTNTTEEITDTKYVYTAAATCTITITPVSGNNYFYSLSVVYPATLQDIEVTFGSNGNYKDSGIDFSGINIRDNGGDNAQIKEGSFSFVVKAGAVVTINGYPSYTSYKLGDGTTTTEEITDTKYVYTAESACTITITPVSGNNYFYSLSVVYPKAPQNMEVTFGSNGNYKDSGIDFSGINIRDNGGDNAQIKEGSFSFEVAAGAKVTINGYPSYTSYKLSDGTTTTEEITDTTYVYTAESACTITITPVSGNNYFYSFSVVYE